MKGPDRPHTMQTTAPPLARPVQFEAIAVAPFSNGHDSEKVDNSTSAWEDWSVTDKPKAASCSRYSLCRSAWFSRPNSLS